MPNKNQPAGKGQWIDTIKLTGSVRVDEKQVIEDTGRMLVYLPAGYKKGDSLPLVIALHGWDQKPEDWRAKTGISSLADKYQVILAAPAMGKSVYEFQYYAETRSKWNKVPGARWIGEVVLPYMRKKYAVSNQRTQCAIIGVSTGGRGAVIVSERYPEFGFAASLSGTYNLGILQKCDGEYKIHANIFGHRDSFPDRWKEEDGINPKWVDTLKSKTLYLAHGVNDPFIPLSQLESMQAFLKGFHSNYQVVAVEKAGHTWRFWNSQLPIIFKLMNQSIQVESKQ